MVIDTTDTNDESNRYGISFKSQVSPITNGEPCEWSELWSGGMGEKNTLRWLGHIERMESEEFVNVYVSESVSPNSRGRWRDRVKEYMCERGATRRRGLHQARGECLDRERWRRFCLGHMGDVRAVVDRQMVKGMSEKIASKLTMYSEGDSLMLVISLTIVLS